MGRLSLLFQKNAPASHDRIKSSHWESNGRQGREGGTRCTQDNNMVSKVFLFVEQLAEA